MKYIYLLLSLTILSCNSNSQSNDILLVGKIGKFDSEINLSKEGDFYKGYFTYLNLDKDKINLRGQIEGDKLRLTEFNDKNEVTGIFVGTFISNQFVGNWSDVNNKYKVHFNFSDKEKSINNTNLNLKGSTLKSKELIQTFFEPTKFITDSIARYKVDNNLFDVEFYKFEKYTLNGTKYKIAIFGHHPLHEFEGVYERGTTTASIGSAKFSVVVFKKNDDSWNVVKEFKDLDIGIDIRGHVYLPQIKQIENFTFLELPDVKFYVSGSMEKNTTLFNIENFTESLNISTSGYQFATGNVDYFLTEMSKNKYDKEGRIIGDEDSYVKNWSDSEYKIKYNVQNNKLLCTVDRISGEFDEGKRKFVKIVTSTIYTYDEKTMKFVNLK